MENKLTLNKKEQIRLMVLNRFERNEIGVGGASSIFKVSERQVWRLLAAYRKEGAAGLVHGNRGRKPANALPLEVRERVVFLARKKYASFNHSHFTEKLNEREKTHLSRSSVRRILLDQGLRSKRKHNSPPHRSRRERYPREGMLLQTDGSRHDWLEGRGPKLCLIGAIDDATGKVPYALFSDQETTEGYMRMLQEIVLREGIPAALYHDRHTIFEVPQKGLPSIEQQLTGKEPRSQFGRLLDELGIESIAANSPQAKGRIERLWGTFQDRLTSELRLARVKTLDKANIVLGTFLADHNRRFGLKAREQEIAYVRPDMSFKAEEYFCLKYERTVGADNVVHFEKHRLQVLSSIERTSYAGRNVEVHLKLDGTLSIYYQGNPLETQPAPLEATRIRRAELATVSSGPHKPGISNRTDSTPSPDYAWRDNFKACFD